MTATFRRAGLLGCLAVDKHRNRNALATIIQLDLTLEGDQKLVMDWLEHPSVIGLFWAPPCGTASAAREIMLEDETDLPKPLRTVLEPDGISFLHGLDAVRVSQANQLYSFCGETFDKCQELGKLAMCENPRSSLFWCTSFWSETRCAPDLFIQDHQACAYGSSRPKWTRLVANFEQVHLINLTCPGNHKHEPWGTVRRGAKRVFATSLEVHYPPGLCKAIVNAFLTKIGSMGFVKDDAVPANPAVQAMSGKQPLTGRLLPMVPEFKSKLIVFRDAQQQLVWPDPHPSLEHCKLLHSFQVGGLEGAENTSENAKNICKASGIDGGCIPAVLPANSWTLQVFGVPWEPLEFIEKASTFEHPLAVRRAVPEVLTEAIDMINQKSHVEIAKHRLKTILFWNKRAKQLEDEERLLKDGMDPIVAKAVANKRILLFREMLTAADYPDVSAAEELAEGAKLIGEVPVTGVLPSKFVPATTTSVSLKKQSELMKSKVFHIANSSGDAEVDAEVWRQTLEEVGEGWLKGPISVSNIDPSCPITKRFGLKQRDKVRLIDDYSDSGVNSCVTCSEAPALHTVDTAAAVLCHWFSTRNSASKPTELEVRTFDLKSAYRQIGLHREGREHGYVAVYCPQEQTSVFFQSLVLPFGATRSVHAFLRLSRAVWWLGVKLLSIVWTNFYDDFIVFSSPGLTSNTSSSVSSLLKLLGWIFATSGKKASPFGPSCKALGIVFDMKLSSLGVAELANTGERVTELCELLTSVIDAGWISGSQARRLHGRMVFADAQIFGRTGKRCMQVLSRCSQRGKSKLSVDDCFFLGLFVDMLKNGKPRTIQKFATEQVLIFTDACYEKEARVWRGGIGGVQINLSLCCWEFFSLELNDDALMKLGEAHKGQMIFEAETLAAVVGFMLWSDSFVGRLGHLFIDNEGTKYCLLRGASDNGCVNELARIFAKHEMESTALTWISRVASHSNIADGPSRNECELVKSKGAVDRSIQALELMDLLITQCKVGDGLRDQSNPT